MESCAAALSDLEMYLALEGPFDGVLAFSQGAMLAATYLAWKETQDQNLGVTDRPFKFAVFFSAWDVYDGKLLHQGQARRMAEKTDGHVINIPTAHIWGRNDSTSGNPIGVSQLCVATSRQVFVHEGAHEVPGSRMSSSVKASVRMIRRVILASQEAGRDDFDSPIE
ncbi:serine hydrolase-domain-containing protein [Xylariaceae sp. FL1272]|nr:serine hydrolase-domain-containing protein [Xylariaceae sp. FL1272]